MNDLKEKLFKLIEERENEMIEIRRHLHQYPELSFEEENTAEYIKSFYQDKNVKISQPVKDEHGIIVEINGGKEGRTIGLRADFDALPITEEADVPFKSTNEGVMHACGHDVHTAYLMGLADALIELKKNYQEQLKSFTSTLKKNLQEALKLSLNLEP